MSKIMELADTAINGVEFQGYEHKYAALLTEVSRVEAELKQAYADRAKAAGRDCRTQGREGGAGEAGAKAMTEPIKLAIEALEWADNSLIEGLPLQVKTQEALAALRSIKPDCRNCHNFSNRPDDYCLLHWNETAVCTNFDKFQALPPVNLTKEKS